MQMQSYEQEYKANNYKVSMSKFDYGSPEDELSWHTEVQEATKHNSCKDAQIKLTPTELLQNEQGPWIFLQWRL